MPGVLPRTLPASLGRGCLGRWLLASRGWALLGAGARSRSCSCLRWRHPPPLLLGAARRSFGTQARGLKAAKSGGNSKDVSVQRALNEETLVSAAQKVKEAGRDFTYFIVVLVGIGVTGGLFYVIFKELFSSSSPNKIYGDALEKCRSHPEIIGVFGDSIKGYGEATRRGRRQHVRLEISNSAKVTQFQQNKIIAKALTVKLERSSREGTQGSIRTPPEYTFLQNNHIEYVKDGLKHMRLKFYIEGTESGKQGTVHVEVKENLETGRFEVRYIFVDVETYPRRTIVIEDNR